MPGGLFGSVLRCAGAARPAGQNLVQGGGESGQRLVEKIVMLLAHFDEFDMASQRLPAVFGIAEIDPGTSATQHVNVANVGLRAVVFQRVDKTGPDRALSHPVHAGFEGVSSVRLSGETPSQNGLAPFCRPPAA